MLIMLIILLILSNQMIFKTCYKDHKFFKHHSLIFGYKTHLGRINLEDLHFPVWQPFLQHSVEAGQVGVVYEVIGHHLLLPTLGLPLRLGWVEGNHLFLSGSNLPLHVFK